MLMETSKLLQCFELFISAQVSNIFNKKSNRNSNKCKHIKIKHFPNQNQNFRTGQKLSFNLKPKINSNCWLFETT